MTKVNSSLLSVALHQLHDPTVCNLRFHSGCEHFSCFLLPQTYKQTHTKSRHKSSISGTLKPARINEFMTFHISHSQVLSPSPISSSSSLFCCRRHHHHKWKCWNVENLFSNSSKEVELKMGWGERRKRTNEMSFDSHRVWDGDCKLENVENVVMLAPCWMWYKRLCVVCRCHKEDERGGKGTDWGWFSVKIWEISFNHTHFYSVLTFLLTSNLSRRQQHRNYWRMRPLSNRTLIIINILKILTLHSDRFSFLSEDGEWMVSGWKER